MEEIIEQRDAVPATIAMLDGKVHVGIHHFEQKRLAEGLEMRKISARDIGPAIALGWSGGTTVAGTLSVA